VPGRTAAILVVPMLLFYGVIAAGAASVARAVTVAVLVLTGRALDHRGPPINALAVASIAAVAAAPVSVLDAGFVLSFGATLGIVLGMSRFRPWTSARGDGWAGHRAFRAAILAIATLGGATFWAELALIPAGATLFGRVSFAGLVLNFIAIPLMTVVQLAGLAMLIAGSVSASAGAAAGWCAHVAATGLLRSSELLELMPWLAARVPPPRWWLVVLYYAAAGFLVLAPRARRGAGAVVAASTAVLLLGPRASSRDAVPAAAMPLRVVVLDVGQGDATVILLPDGRAILVDAGGLATFGAPDPVEAFATFDIGERVVFPALRALGVKSLHAFAITHGDPDHLQGARGLLRDLGAATVWEGVPVPPHPGLQALTSWAGIRRVSWRTVQAGDVERFGGSEIRVLHPPLPEWERQRVRNEDSIVLEVRLG
jgi:competence protein ComEC